ncbi:MAG: hypothetical protein JW892_09605 [Anaerolineae bacterium]|nr:hypothetical protein [Anaerolineae bacterium]
MSDLNHYPPTPQRQRPSVFWPIVLILGGIVLLLSNLGYLPEPSWELAARLWPVIFIALGIDLVVGRRSIAGAIISTILILALAAGVLGLIFFARHIPALAELAREPVLESHTISHPVVGIEQAELRLDWSSQSGVLEALDDSEQLLEGEITTYDTLDFTVDRLEDTAQVRINTRETTPIFNIRSISTFGSVPWEIALNSGVTWDLNLDGGSGNLELDLSELDLEALELDGGSGAIALNLPATGSFEGRIDGGSGAITVTVPDDVGVRIVLDNGSGAFQPATRFTRVEGNDNETVWESEDYENAETQILLWIDQGSGAIRVK